MLNSKGYAQHARMENLPDFDQPLGIHSTWEVLILKSLEHFREKSSLAFGISGLSLKQVKSGRKFTVRVVSLEDRIREH